MDFILVPGEGLEPSRDYSSQKVLSLSRLPVSPPGPNLRRWWELHPRITVLQTVAFSISPHRHTYSDINSWIIFFILSYFSFFFNFSKISSIFPASTVFFSSKNFIFGIGLIFNLLFNFCCKK